MANNELARSAGVPVSQLTELLEGKVCSQIAERIGVPVAALDAFINGGARATTGDPLGEITPGAAFAVGKRDVAIGIILRMLLAPRS